MVWLNSNLEVDKEKKFKGEEKRRTIEGLCVGVMGESDGWLVVGGSKGERGVKEYGVVMIKEAN